MLYRIRQFWDDGKMIRSWRQHQQMPQTSVGADLSQPTPDLSARPRLPQGISPTFCTGLLLPTARIDRPSRPPTHQADREGSALHFLFAIELHDKKRIDSH